MSETTTRKKPPRAHTKNKKHQKHHSQPSKHFISTGQAAPIRNERKKRKPVDAEIAERFKAREIVSNVAKYEEHEEILDEQEKLKQLTMKNLRQDVGGAYFRKPWEKEWEAAENISPQNHADSVFAIDAHFLERDLQLLSIQERLKLQADILDHVMCVSHYAPRAKRSLPMPLEEMQLQQEHVPDEHLTEPLKEKEEEENVYVQQEEENVSVQQEEENIYVQQEQIPKQPETVKELVKTEPLVVQIQETKLKVQPEIARPTVNLAQKVFNKDHTTKHEMSLLEELINLEEKQGVATTAAALATASSQDSHPPIEPVKHSADEKVGEEDLEKWLDDIL